jgi:hypothetical protein
MSPAPPPAGAAVPAAPPTIPLQQVLFLDTNAMHYARLYHSFGRQHSLLPFGPSLEDPADALRRVYAGRGFKIEGLERGLKYFSHLRDKSQEGWRVEFAPMSRLELVCGLLKGHAIADAAGDGIALRMWSRIEEEEILGRLQLANYETVDRNTGELEDDFAKVGIELSETSPERIQEVWSLSKRLLSLVFLDAADCIVYASALLAEADELLTADGYLRMVATAIENPGARPKQRAYFEQVKTRLIQLVAESIGVNAAAIALPKAPKVGST